MTIRDDLPPSTPKGYVDIGNYSLGYLVVYSLQDGKKVKEGSVYADQGLRIARTPGTHAFIIVHGDDSGQEKSQPVNVDIQRDMVNFITVNKKIIEVVTGINDREPMKRITYTISFSASKEPAPVNFESTPDKKEALSKLLNDPDWRARIYAIDILKMNMPVDPDLINIVRTHAIDDPQRSVRKKAVALLKGVGIDPFQNLLLLENFEFNKRKWIDMHRQSDYFYNDELVLTSSAGACGNEMMRSPLDLPADFDVELLSTWKSGNDSDAYGILIGADKDNLYHFGISGSGQAVVRLVKKDEAAGDIVAWTGVPSIKRSGKETNRMRVSVRGDTWKYFVNDVFVGTVTNQMKRNTYTLGLRVCQAQTVSFDQLKIIAAGR